MANSRVEDAKECPGCDGISNPPNATPIEDLEELKQPARDRRIFYSKIKLFNKFIIKKGDFCIVKYLADDGAGLRCARHQLRTDEAVVRISEMWRCSKHSTQVAAVEWLYYQSELPKWARRTDPARSMELNDMALFRQDWQEADRISLYAILDRCVTETHYAKSWGGQPRHSTPKHKFREVTYMAEVNARRRHVQPCGPIKLHFAFRRAIDEFFHGRPVEGDDQAQSSDDADSPLAVQRRDSTRNCVVKPAVSRQQHGNVLLLSSDSESESNAPQVRPAPSAHPVAPVSTSAAVDPMDSDQRSASLSVPCAVALVPSKLGDLETLISQLLDDELESETEQKASHEPKVSRLVLDLARRKKLQPRSQTSRRDTPRSRVSEESGRASLRLDMDSLPDAPGAAASTLPSVNGVQLPSIEVHTGASSKLDADDSEADSEHDSDDAMLEFGEIDEPEAMTL